MSRRHRAGTERNAQEAGDLNEYFTPPEAVRALLSVEALPHVIWEPACGTGNIVEVLRAHGRDVFASDVAEHGCPESCQLDFMGADAAKVCSDMVVSAIVTNPPFSLIGKGWIERCLAFAPEVFLLARIQLLEGARRTQVIEKGGLRRIYVFRERLPMMHKRGFLEAGGKPSTSTMAFAWFCWRRGWRGQASVKRISWKSHGPALEPPRPALPKSYCRATIDMFEREAV